MFGCIRRDTGYNIHHYNNKKLGGGNVALDSGLFIAIAEIAGVFVGFGALISLTRKDAIDFPQLGRLRGVVSVGLVVIVAALIPVGISRYVSLGMIFGLCVVSSSSFLYGLRFSCLSENLSIENF